MWLVAVVIFMIQGCLVEAQDPLYEIPSPFRPESFTLANTSPSVSFYMGSTSTGEIFVTKPDNTAEVFITDPRIKGKVTLGVHRVQDKLYFTSNPANLIAPLKSGKAIPNMGALVIADVQSKSVVSVIDLSKLNRPDKPNWAGLHVANDVTVDKNGNMFVSDSFQGLIWKVQAGATDSSSASIWAYSDFLVAPAGQIFGANGLAVTPKGDYIVIVNARTAKLYRVSATTKSGTFEEVTISTPDNFKAGGMDGLRFDGDVMYLTDSVNSRVLKLTSTDGWKTAQAVGAAGFGKSCQITTVATTPAQGVYTFCAFNTDATRIFQAFAPSSPVDSKCRVTQYGEVCGVDEGQTTAFYGIPFAADPSAENRWRPPQPPTPWTDPLKASTLPKACIQADTIRIPGSDQSEDCLYLNIITPTKKSDFPLPVMIWIHGGSFRSGSAHRGYPAMNTTNMVNSMQNVIIVAIQYRLGPFGFLASEALRGRDVDGSVGNWGLLDQRAAMKFVSNNIQQFGGDASRVTIFGESAGAGSVYDHMVMKKSWQWFNNAIMQSGAGDFWVAGTMKAAEWSFQEALTKTKCDGVECLVKADVEVIRSLNSVRPLCAALNQLVFFPTIDGVELPAHPNDLVGSGQFNQVPTILGFNNDEWTLFQNVSATADATLFGANVGIYTQRNMGAIKQVSSLYVSQNSEPTSTSPVRSKYFWGTERFLSDVAFACPGYKAGVSMSLLLPGNSHVYSYLFIQPNSKGLTPHAAEIPWVFNNPFVTKAKPELGNTLAQYWTNFATTGNPNTNGLPLLVKGLPKWEPFSADWSMQVLGAPNGAGSIVSRKSTPDEDSLRVRRCSLVNNLETLFVAKARASCPQQPQPVCSQQSLRTCLIKASNPFLSIPVCDRAFNIRSCYYAAQCQALLSCASLQSSCPSISC